MTFIETGSQKGYSGWMLNSGDRKRIGYYKAVPSGEDWSNERNHSIMAEFYPKSCGIVQKSIGYEKIGLVLYKGKTLSAQLINIDGEMGKDREINSGEIVKVIGCREFIVKELRLFVAPLSSIK